MTQIQYDLQDHADLSGIEHDGRYTPRQSRAQLAAEALGLDADEITTVRHGSYQGEIVLLFRYDRYTVVLKDSYGSCSVCDGVLACSDSEQLRSYTERMLANADVYLTDDGAVEGVQAKEGYYWTCDVGMVEDQTLREKTLSALERL